MVLFGGLALHYGTILYVTLAGTNIPSLGAPLYIRIQSFGVGLAGLWAWLSLIVLLGCRSPVPTQMAKQLAVIIMGNFYALIGLSNSANDSERATSNLIFLNLYKEFGRAMIVSSAYHLAAREVGGVTGRVDRSVVVVPLLAFQVSSK
jgi:hypothetical protein